MTASPDVFTIAEFCAVHHISRTTFYALKETGQGPRTFKVGRRVLITREAADDWRKKLEKAEAEAAEEAIRKAAPDRRAKIHREIKRSFVYSGISLGVAEEVINLIEAGKIAHVLIVDSQLMRTHL